MTNVYTAMHYTCIHVHVNLLAKNTCNMHVHLHMYMCNNLFVVDIHTKALYHREMARYGKGMVEETQRHVHVPHAYVHEHIRSAHKMATLSKY